jgi:hypothetical protein
MRRSVRLYNVEPKRKLLAAFAPAIDSAVIIIIPLSNTLIYQLSSKWYFKGAPVVEQLNERLSAVDPEVQQAIAQELVRQQSTLWR